LGHAPADAVAAVLATVAPMLFCRLPNFALRLAGSLKPCQEKPDKEVNPLAPLLILIIALAAVVTIVLLWEIWLIETAEPVGGLSLLP